MDELVVFEGKDTKRRQVLVTRRPSSDPVHPGHYTLTHDGEILAEADAEYLGRAFDVTSFIRAAGIRLPKAHRQVDHLGEG